MELTIDDILTQIVSLGASDLHIKVGSPPIMRLQGQLAPVPDRPVLDKDKVNYLLDPLINLDLQKAYQDQRSVDFSYSIENVSRFRVNLFIQQGLPGAAFRPIPQKIPTLAELKAPAILLDFAKKPRGLCLVTGPTGSGKSTTLAAVLDVINSTRSAHILTIEDPIEFVHTSKYSLINQREVGRDTPSFERGLRDALREDPDVILVGEMRDLDTMRIAMTAAETGHLVFGTLHTSSATSAIDRIIDVFPEGEQQQIKTMLAASLVGIVTQALLPTTDGQSRIAAHEILVSSNPVRALIRQGKTEQLRNTLQTKSEEGNQSLDRALIHLISQGMISEEVGRNRAQNEKEFDSLLTSFRAGATMRMPELVSEGQSGLSTQ